MINIRNLIATSGDVWSEFSTSIQAIVDGFWLPIVVILFTVAIILAVKIGWSYWNAGGDEIKVQKLKASIKWYIVGWIVFAILTLGIPTVLKILAMCL